MATARAATEPNGTTTSVGASAPTDEGACVGREAELSKLAELARQARESGERLALVEGPSGSGKSRLLNELKSRLRLEGGVVLEGRAIPGRAFGPLATIVDRALRFLGDMSMSPTIDLADLGCFEGCHRFWHQHAAHHDSALSTASRVAQERRLHFFEAIRGLLRDVARVRAPIVILHDLDRADEGTLQLLRYVFEGAGPWTDRVAPERSLHALFVASTMPGVARLEKLRSHEVSTVLELGHLDTEGVRAYLQSNSVVGRVLDRTGGMPEAIERLLEAEPLEPEELLGRRIAALPEDARAMVELLSVLEHPTDLDELAGILGVMPDARARHALAECDLLHRSILEGRILFSFCRERHRELTYESLERAQLEALHQRCAEHFAKQPGHERAGHHALCAGDFERAIPLCLDEARNLAARHAHAEAAALLERVVEACPSDAIPTEVQSCLSELYRVVGEYRRALEYAEEVRKADPESAAACLAMGRLHTLAGDLGDAQKMLVTAHDLAAEDDVVRTTVETQLAELHYQRASYDDAERWATKALEQALALGDRPLEIHARNTLGKVALARREAHAAAELFETNRDLAAGTLGHQHAQALTNLGVAMLRAQQLEDARDCFAEAVEVATEVNDSRDRAIAIENLAVLAHLARDYREALAQYHTAVALLKRLGNRAMLARIAINLGELYLSLGDAGRAAALCDFAQHMGGTSLPRVFEAECMKLRGQVYFARADHDMSRAVLETSLQTLEELGSIRRIQPMLMLVRLALADGDVARARELLTQVPTVDSPKHGAELAIVAAELERASGGDVLAAARRALRQAEEAGDEELVLDALIGLCEASASSRRDDARETLRRAYEIEASLTERVPEECLESWTRRPARARLNELERRLPSVSRSSHPPPSMRDAALDKAFPEIVGSAPKTLRLLEMLTKVAPSDATVLVRGESGTGKELVAEALHRNSERADRPLVKVNCAALVETLLMSELFGHERGAFTGASARKKGRFELADGGTLFLDEIGDISPKTQVALLRVLQEREFERVGGTSPIKVDVRIIAATHRDLEAMVADGSFREDLYYRLRGVSVEVPALRERQGDLGELCDRLLARIGEERGDPAKRVSRDAMSMLRRHRWPGNVRELENVLRSASLFAENDLLHPADFAAFSETFDLDVEDDVVAAPAVPLEDAIYVRIREGDTSLLDMKKVIERECIVRALSESDGNITRAASLLGMKRPRLSQLVKQYGLAAKKSRKRARS